MWQKMHSYDGGRAIGIRFIIMMMMTMMIHDDAADDDVAHEEDGDETLGEQDESERMNVFIDGWMDGWMDG